MDTQDPPVGGEQRRGMTTQDLVDWAHQRQRPEEGAQEQRAQEQRVQRAGVQEPDTAAASPAQAASAEAAPVERGSATVPQDTQRVAAPPPTDQPVGQREAVADQVRTEPQPAGATAELAGTGAGAVTAEQPTPLFNGEQVRQYRGRWTQLQVAFVDEPRRAVQQADELVAEVMQTLAATFAENKRQLESQWRREGQADTEELRLALRRYRTFFDQLLRG
jgi:hypothetical protein